MALSQSGDLRTTLTAADSLLSLAAYRLSPDFGLQQDMKRVSSKCRAAADSLNDADALAVKVAEAIWPRHAGDLTKRQWERCYAVLDALLGAPAIDRRKDA